MTRQLPEKVEHSFAFVGTFKMHEIFRLRGLKRRTIDVTEKNSSILKALMDNYKQREEC